MTKKILHIIDSLETGGAEILLIGLVNGMKQYDHFILTLTPKNDFNIQINAKIECVNYRGKIDTLKAISHINSIIKSNGIDLVHTHLLTSTFLGRLGKPSKTKLVFSVHNILSESAFKVSKLSWLLEKITYRGIHHVIFVSQEAKKDYDKSIGLKGNSSVIYNYVEDNFFDNNLETGVRPGSDSPLKLVAVGSLKSQKNYHFLISSLVDYEGDVQLDIYGDGPLRKSLHEYIHLLGIHQKVRLMGKHKKISTILPAYDLYVMASTYEGFGIAPLEALASSIPALLSEIPVFKEVIGDNAIFFDPKSKEDFNSKLLQLQSKPTLRHKLSKTGRERAEEIGKKVDYIRKIDQLYNRYI
ncbi:MAG: glycosyltransferase [Ekhidna sp.]